MQISIQISIKKLQKKINSHNNKTNHHKKPSGHKQYNNSSSKNQQSPLYNFHNNFNKYPNTDIKLLINCIFKQNMS